MTTKWCSHPSTASSIHWPSLRWLPNNKKKCGEKFLGIGLSANEKTAVTPKPPLGKHLSDSPQPNILLFFWFQKVSVRRSDVVKFSGRYVDINVVLYSQRFKKPSMSPVGFDKMGWTTVVLSYCKICFYSQIWALVAVAHFDQLLELDAPESLS